MNKDIKDLFKRLYQFDRPGWDTLKQGIEKEWSDYCESSCCPSPSEAQTNHAKGRGSVWKSMRDLILTIEKSETR